MGIFDFFKKNRDVKIDPVEVETDDLKIDPVEVETDDLVIDVFERICEKCEYGENIKKLNEHERVIYITQTLEQEINNGGFSQYFFNSSGNLANESVDAFTKIGALKTAEICKKALDLFGGNVPADPEARQELLEELDCDDEFDKLDDAFYDYEDNLEGLNSDYIMKHREYFDC